MSVADATNGNPGDDSLASIMGGIAEAIHTASNQLSALRSQNADIAGGRWTLNNVAYQYGQLSPVAQVALMGALAYVALHLMGGN